MKKAELWARWRPGESTCAITPALGRDPRTVRISPSSAAGSTMRRSQHAAGRGPVARPDCRCGPHQRAASEDRAILGHWEGDLLADGRQSRIATLVERHSRYVMLTRVAGKRLHQCRPRLVSPRPLAAARPDDLVDVGSGHGLATHKRFTRIVVQA